MKLTYPTSLVLQALFRGSHHGFDIMDVTGLPSGTVYPILRRLDREGLLESAWEKAADAQREQRPPRRYYEITPAAEALLVEAAARYRALDQAVRRVPRRLKPSRAAVSMLSRGRTGSGLGAGGSGLGRKDTSSWKLEAGS